MSTSAVMFDALGTLVELEPPWLHLADALGVQPDEHLASAVRAEMDYYRDHSHEGRDADSLAELRGRCAVVLSKELGEEVSVATMMAAIRFRAFPDAAPALADLRLLGLRLVCVSNWDVSLPEVLERCGLGGALDGSSPRPSPAFASRTRRSSRPRWSWPGARLATPCTSATRPPRTP
jgi:putative hydrolase of the HAD superfamily